VRARQSRCPSSHRIERKETPEKNWFFLSPLCVRGRTWPAGLTFFTSQERQREKERERERETFDRILNFVGVTRRRRRSPKGIKRWLAPSHNSDRVSLTLNSARRLGPGDFPSRNRVFPRRETARALGPFRADRCRRLWMHARLGQFSIKAPKGPAASAVSVN
jgi:hypothetical protein